MKSLFLVLIIQTLALTVLFGEDRFVTMPEKHLETFEMYCYDCHDEATTKGQVNLESLSFEITKNIETAERWQKVLDVLNSGEMPPKQKDQIPDAEKAAFLEDLSTRMVTARDVLSDTGGEITMRRMNRREYGNTLQALLGHKPDVSNLPDDSVEGFDTSGASLFMSSDQFENYLKVARRALRDASLPSEQPAPRVLRVEAEDYYTTHYQKVFDKREDKYQRALAFQSQKGKPAADFGFMDAAEAEKVIKTHPDHHEQLTEYLKRPEIETGAPIIFYVRNGAGKKTLFTPQVRDLSGGRYVLRFRVAAYDVPPEYLKYVEFGFQAAGSSTLTILGERKVTGTLEQPSLFEVEVDHPRGVKGRYFIRQLDYFSRSSRAYVWKNIEKETGAHPKPNVWIDYFELEGPIHSEWPPRQTAFTRHRSGEPTSLTEARDGIAHFAEKAFRGKSISTAFLERLMTRVQEKQAEGLSLKKAVEDAYALILTSPSFLYLLEPRSGDQLESIDDRELAVRLSYFLWSAPPDDELLTLAAKGRLSQPEVLKAQTQRLLADSRSGQFVESFVHQWLDMERLEMFQFHSKNHPKFNEAIRRSARQEVFHTFRTVMDENLPLMKLLKADFVVINDMLAEFYGIPGVTGSEFRKVSVPATSPRGGLLGMAATHIMGSDGVRSSPVERGVWVLKHLLNNPPPPAPANVPMLSRFEGDMLPARHLLKAHMEQPQCFQCHHKIDPIGYGLENFTAAGLWRDQEEIVTFKKRHLIDKRAAFPIDPSGKLPSGKKFQDFDGLRKAVAAESRSFAGSLTEALIAYGLGRPFSFSDHNLADEIQAAARSQGNTIDSFIHAFVQSRAFRLK